jgi:hypothetical protein
MSYKRYGLGQPASGRSWWEDAACIALGPACWAPQAAEDYQARQPLPPKDFGPPSTVPPGTPSGRKNGGFPWWGWLLIGVGGVALFGGGTVLYRRRRRAGSRW